MTDFRALCAELADSLEDWLSSNSIGGISLDDGTDAELIFRARTALAQPEPQGPTGRTAIEPVPVTERLPGPEDCDAEGRCFVWDWLATEWRFLERNVFEYGWEDAYWLPHHTLPVPQQEADHG